jgi:hypothetical protein
MSDMSYTLDVLETNVSKPSKERRLLDLAEKCGAVLTGKPDGSEAVTVVFTVAAWRAFAAAIRETTI